MIGASRGVEDQRARADIVDERRHPAHHDVRHAGQRSGRGQHVAHAECGSNKDHRQIVDAPEIAWPEHPHTGQDRRQPQTQADERRREMVKRVRGPQAQRQHEKASRFLLRHAPRAHGPNRLAQESNGGSDELSKVSG